MQSLARVASRVGTLLRSQEGSLARAAQQTRGFAAGGCPGHAMTIGPPGMRAGDLPAPLAAAAVALPACRCDGAWQRWWGFQAAFCMPQPLCCIHVREATSALPSVHPAGGHGHHDSVTHAGLTIHKAASWHKYTGQAFAGLMWCVECGCCVNAANRMAGCCCCRA